MATHSAAGQPSAAGEVPAAVPSGGANPESTGAGPAIPQEAPATAASAPPVGDGGTPAPPVTSELRIALAMSGAIALVLYESGVAHEIYRFLRAWEARPPGTSAGPEEKPCVGYHAAFKAIPIRPVLDILTGASAGGINSVFLGSCIATGQDFEEFHDVWIDTAGVERLRQAGPGQPRSLLSAEPLRTAMETVLHVNARRSNGRPVDSSPELVVRLCRTHQLGHCLIARDAIDHRMEVQTKDDVIGFNTEHFVRWDKGPDGRKGPVEAQVRKLAAAALATSAFPGAFAPVQDEGRWYIDGGLWNNQPINLAVQAVRDKPAFLRTHRCILFIEPNPARVSEEEEATTEREAEPSLAAVLSGLVFMGVKGNIWPAVQDILDYNRRNALYAKLEENKDVQEAVEALGHQEQAASRSQLLAVRSWPAGGGQTRVELESMYQNPVSAIPTVLNQTRTDEILFDSDLALIQRWNSMVERLGYAANRPRETKCPAINAFLAALCALDATGTVDLQRLVVRRELASLNGELAQATDGAGKAQRIAAQKALRYAKLEQLNAYLYSEDTSQEDDPRRRFLETQRNYLTAALTRAQGSPTPDRRMVAGIRRQQDRIVQRLRWLDRRDRERSDTNAATQDTSIYRLGQLRASSRFRLSTESMLAEAESALGKEPDETAQTLVEIILQEWRAHVQEVAHKAQESKHEPDKVNGLRPLDEEDVRRLTDQERDQGQRYRYDAIKLYYRQAEGEADRAGSPSENVLGHSKLLIEELANLPRCWDPKALDVMLHVLAAISDLPGRRPIDLVRISPNDTDNLHLIADRGRPENTAAVRKLAGEGLGHFTGFFESRWRRNDYIWGRLDACEILLRTLWKYGRREGLPLSEDQYEEWLVDAQTTILKDEVGFYKKWLKRHDAEEGRRQEQDPEWEQCGGIRRSTDDTYDGPAQRIQRANSRLIGFGHETLQDAVEPDFSNNVDALLRTCLQLAKGNRDQPPAALDRLSRALRIASYPLKMVAASAPVKKPSVRGVWRWIGVTLLLVAMVAALAWVSAKGDPAGWLMAIIYTLAAGAFLVACGCGLGFRWWSVIPAMLFLGVVLGRVFPPVPVQFSWMPRWLNERAPDLAKSIPDLILPAAALLTLFGIAWPLLSRWQSERSTRSD
jgi:hypothetical protein